MNLFPDRQGTAPVLVVHGGAGNIPEEKVPLHREGLAQALDAGWAVLEGGGTALDAVLAAVQVMEELPQFNAGRGSALNREGGVEMDAGIMDGPTLDVGAVAAVSRVAHPIRLAYEVMRHSPHILLVAEGAERFAAERGIPLVPPESLITDERRQRLQKLLAEGGMGDTVGAVALDGEGRLAAGTSTGGMMGKWPGRVGDSPLVGAGFYADTWGACSTTGIGESIARALLAYRAVSGLMGGTPPQDAAREAIAFLARHIPRGEAGLILLDREGRVAAFWNTRRMSFAYRTVQGPVIP